MKRAIFFFSISGLLLLSVNAQTTEKASGTDLYRRGDFSRAVVALSKEVKSKEGKANADLWNRLGLAETAIGEYKKAAKSFRKATDLNGQDPVFWSNLGYARLRLRDLDGARSATDRAIQIEPNYMYAYYIRGLAHLWEGQLDDAQKNYEEIKQRDNKYANGYIFGSWIQVARLNRELSKSKENANIRDHLDQLKIAVDILQTGIENCGDCQEKEKLKKEHEGLDYFYKHYLKEPKPPTGVPAQPQPGVTPYRILSKPRAQYSGEARNRMVSGSVRLLVLLMPDGTVGHIFVLHRLGYGLDENAIAAARSIKFEPKRVNGVPVPAVVTVDYGFKIF